MSTETLDLKKLTASEKAELMKQLAKDAKAEKQKIKEDRKAYKELTYDFVNRNIDGLIHHNDVTGIIIQKLFEDYAPVKSIKNEVYGHEPQDSHTSTLSDGSASITIGHNVSINFDGTEASGVKKIKDFIKSLLDETADDKTKKLAKMVDIFLKENPKTGMLNPSKIIELSKLRDEFDDERFDDGLDIIFNAQIRVQNSMYVSGWKFIEVDGISKKLSFRFSV
ncbi:conserved hypothetical protein [Formosa agariphila KMM 3901]|uniref:Uncharacterized protein n=1 Tax=Formosa agariphila (strain DSM 15362 / KCTC 12365 / LMG 23005 / KMM 3901 / M-2Alg 35-1) TaxID=1347342 RepID=T2KRG0_FORAG|nr:hypothetical protein [Formosa agariphila]CDF80604.1 conserved hypothetical protein [Formosa agariphila KMM 3901]